MPLLEHTVRQQYVGTSSHWNQLEITDYVVDDLVRTESYWSELLRHISLPAGAVEVAGFAESHVVDRRRSHGVVPPFRGCQRRHISHACGKRHSVASGLRKATPIRAPRVFR